MALDALQAYRQGGNLALGTYRDKDKPAEVGKIFESLLTRVTTLPVYLPELNRVLLDFPSHPPIAAGRIESDFYWEKVDFGLKPTLRMVHRLVFRGAEPNEPSNAVVLKQLYASHYFQAALDLSVCVRDQDRPERKGFYLITVKGSHQAGLTGLKGGIIRRGAVSKTRASLEKTLAAIKTSLEK